MGRDLSISPKPEALHPGSSRGSAPGPCEGSSTLSTPFSRSCLDTFLGVARACSLAAHSGGMRPAAHRPGCRLAQSWGLGACAVVGAGGLRSRGGWGLSELWLESVNAEVGFHLCYAAFTEFSRRAKCSFLPNIRRRPPPAEGYRIMSGLSPAFPRKENGQFPEQWTKK